MKKIIVRMMGGIGNQLFIIAFVYSLIQEIDEDCEIVIDNRGYKSYKLRKLEILDLIKDNRVRLYDSSKDRCVFYDITRTIFHFIQKISNPNKQIFGVFTKMGLFYSKRNSTHLNNCNKKNIYVYGYFQDEKMTKKVKKDMIDKIVFPITNKTNNSIAISVRCGEDYVKQGWPICDKDYYEKGLKEIINKKYKNKNYNVWIFSDDIEKAKKLNICSNATYVENKSSIEQLAMMNNCDDFIISNSSFSWWGAYLGFKKDSIIICPDFWYSYKDKTVDCLLNYDYLQIRNLTRR